MSDADLKESLEAALAEIESLRDRVNELEKPSDRIKRPPRTALLNDKFLTRAFAVWGHSFVAGLIIMIPIWLFALIIAAMVGALR